MVSQYQHDWLMRQIESFAIFLAKKIFDRDQVAYEIADETHLNETDMLHNKLMALLEQHRICEAENLLFNELDETKKEHLRVALDFYQRLNRLSSEELEAHNFSRDEIKDGISEVLSRFKLSGLMALSMW